MGNECGTNICYGQNFQELHVHKAESKQYLRLLKSELSKTQLPTQLIPQTVKQKIQQLNIDLNIDDSKALWKVQEEEQDCKHIIYTITDKQASQKQANQQSNTTNLLDETKSMNKTFNPLGLQQITILVFKQLKQQNSTPNEQSRVQKPSMVLDKVYYGLANSQMACQNATVISQNGQYYQGNIKDLKYQGKGKMSNAIGTHEYQGEWKHGLPNGHGTQKLANNFTFDGRFVNGKWDGKGELTVQTPENDKFKYIGNFFDGSLQGQGKILKNNDHLIYEGQFLNGKQHGRGKWTNYTGQQYEGQFIQGKKQGHGTFRFSPEVKYVGSFKDGKPDGQGILYMGQKQIHGVWYKGQNILTRGYNPQPSPVSQTSI